MKQLRTSDEIEGKTITKSYEDSDNLWLGFSDGTFIIFTVKIGYYDSATLEVETKEPTLLENTQAVLKLGISNVRELASLEQQRRAEFEKRREQDEKNQLARLLAK